MQRAQLNFAGNDDQPDPLVIEMGRFTLSIAPGRIVIGLAESDDRPPEPPRQLSFATKETSLPMLETKDVTYLCQAPQARNAPNGPRCGEVIDPARAGLALSRGKTPTYCTERCRQKANDSRKPPKVSPV